MSPRAAGPQLFSGALKRVEDGAVALERAGMTGEQTAWVVSHRFGCVFDGGASLRDDLRELLGSVRPGVGLLFIGDAGTQAL